MANRMQATTAAPVPLPWRRRKIAAAPTTLTRKTLRARTPPETALPFRPLAGQPAPARSGASASRTRLAVGKAAGKAAGKMAASRGRPSPNLQVIRGSTSRTSTSGCRGPPTWRSCGGSSLRPPGAVPAWRSSRPAACPTRRPCSASSLPRAPRASLTWRRTRTHLPRGPRRSRTETPRSPRGLLEGQTFGRVALIESGLTGQETPLQEGHTPLCAKVSLSSTTGTVQTKRAANRKPRHAHLPGA